MTTRKKLPFYVDANDPPAKQRILTFALKLFSERGLDGTSIRDIAERTGFTNPALYKHFSGKDELALYLFEVCHQYMWRKCSAALASGRDFNTKLDTYIGKWLELLDEYPEVLAFLSDSARTLWPKSNAAVRRNTMIGLARSLFQGARAQREDPIDPDVAAACLQGSLAELARMIQVGVIKGPAILWREELVRVFSRLV